MLLFYSNLVKRKRLGLHFIYNARYKSKKSTSQKKENATGSVAATSSGVNYSATLNLPKPMGFELSMKNICQLEERIRNVL
jgi:hypothetical protein